MSEEKGGPAGKDARVKVDAGDPDGGTVGASAPRRGEPLAWIVLFLLLAAAGGSAFLWQQFQVRHRMAQNQFDDLAQRVQTVSAQLDTLRSQTADREALKAVADSAERSADALQSRVSALESELGELRSLGSRDRRAWLDAETGHLLRLADDEARIAANPAAAIAALEAADSRIQTMADPRMTPVRAGIADALTRLHAVAIPDIAGMSLELDALGKEMPTLPLAHRTGRDYAAKAPVPAPTDKQSLWQRFRAEIGAAFHAMVTIRRDNPDARPLLAPDAEQYLRLNLQLRLDAARVALLRHDQAGFRANLEAVSEWLGTYFAADDAGVKAARVELAELAKAPVALELPDVSAPLTTFEKVRAAEAAPR